MPGETRRGELDDREFYDAVDPVGRAVRIGVDANAAEGFTPDQLDTISAFVREHGYAVVRGVVPVEILADANDAFLREVKVDPRPFYRLSGNAEAHTFTDSGFMFDGLRDIQSLDRRRSPEFTRASMKVVTHPALTALVEAVLGAPGKIVQTMYFEGNAATQPHQDTYYLDAEPLGTMIGAWVAAEDIAPGAGRFYVCPDSQQADLPANAGHFDIVDSYDHYLQAVRAAMREVPLPVYAPALHAGDVLFWSAGTIHGSLETSQPDRSRRSFTAHYIPESAPFLQWQRRVVPLKLKTVNGVPVHHPKDLNRMPTRIRYTIESRFPADASRLKRFAARHLIRT